MKVAIQGIKGSYHHKVALEFFDDDIDIWLAETGIILGLFGGIFNVDKSMKYIEN